MIVEATLCGHPPADTVDELYCTVCGVLVVEGIERCGKVNGGFVCLQSKGHKRQHLGVDTTSRADLELLILSRAW